MSVMQATPCCKSDTRPPPSPSSRRSTTGSAKCTMWRIATKPLFHRSYSTAQKNCGKDAASGRLSPMEGSASGCAAPAAPASGQSKSMADGTGAAADMMKKATVVRCTTVVFFILYAIFHLFSRLSLRRASHVPRLWNNCTSRIRITTATSITRYL